MTAPSAWTNPPTEDFHPTDWERTYTVRDRGPSEHDLVPSPIFRRLPDGTLVVTVRRVPEPVPGISDGLRRTLIAMALTTIIAISLGAIAYFRLLS